MSKFLSRFSKTGTGRQFTGSSGALTLVEPQVEQAQAQAQVEPEAELHGLFELYPPKIISIVEQISTSFE